MIRKFFEHVWGELRFRLLVGGGIILFVSGLALSNATARYLSEPHARAVVTSVEQSCALIDREGLKQGRPKVISLPCADVEAAKKGNPALLEVQNRSARIGIAFASADGRSVNTVVTPSAIGLSSQARPGDAVWVSYEQERPAASVRTPSNGTILPIGWVVFAIGLYRYGNSVWRLPSTQALSQSLAGAWQSYTASREAAKLKPASRSRSAAVGAARRPAVQRASRWI